MVTREKLEELWQELKEKYVHSINERVFVDLKYIRVTQFLMAIYNKKIRLEYTIGDIQNMPHPVGSPEYFREVLVNKASFWHAGIYSSKYIELESLQLLKDVVASEEFKEFLKSKATPPKYLLDLQGHRTDKVTTTYDGLGQVFKDRGCVAWGVYNILYGSEEMTLSVDPNLGSASKRYTVQLKAASNLDIKTNDNVKNAGVAGSVVAALCKADRFDVWEMYELTVNSDKERVPRLTTRCQNLEICKSYHAHDLPELNIMALEDTLARMTLDLQEMREMYNKHRGRYPKSLPEALLGIVENIFTFYANYLTNPFPHKFEYLNHLVKIVLEGYPTDKILIRLKKEMSKRYVV